MSHDLIKAFPQDTSAKKALKSAIQELVDSMVRADAEKELQKSIFEATEDKYSVDKSFVKQQATLLYDQVYNNKKKQKQIEEANEMLELFKETFKD